MCESYDAVHGLNRAAGGEWSEKKQGSPEISLVGRSPAVIAALRGVRLVFPTAGMVRMTVVREDDWTTKLAFPPTVDEIYVDSDLDGNLVWLEPQRDARVRGTLAALNRALLTVTDATELGEDYDDVDERGHLHLNF